MFKKLQNKIIIGLSRRPFKNDDEIYLYLMSFAANAFAFFTHAYLFFVFLFAGPKILMFLNLFSMCFYAVTYFMVKKRKFAFFGLCLSIEVTFYATAFGLLCGMATHAVAYYMLVIVMQSMVPYGKTRMRVCVIALTVLCATGCVFLNAFVPAIPVFTFSKMLETLMLISNIYILIFGTVLELSVGNIFNIIIRKINESKIAELSMQTFTDPLTGLYNRRYADQYFQTFSSATSQCCVAMLDIDDFKIINDTYGHACGDETLEYLGNFLKKNLRKSDVIFRWGGEEFLMILVDVNIQEAYIILDTLRKLIRATTIPTVQKAVKITATIGVAPLNIQDIDKSIEQSDERLYHGKRNGKNQVVC